MMGAGSAAAGFGSVLGLGRGVVRAVVAPAVVTALASEA
jgi:hypothetical protein